MRNKKARKNEQLFIYFVVFLHSINKNQVAFILALEEPRIPTRFPNNIPSMYFYFFHLIALYLLNVADKKCTHKGCRLQPNWFISGLYRYPAVFKSDINFSLSTSSVSHNSLRDEYSSRNFVFITLSSILGSDGRYIIFTFLQSITKTTPHPPFGHLPFAREGIAALRVAIYPLKGKA